MGTFKGFQEGKVRFTPLPGPFFSELLPEIDHLGELKLTLYVLWRLDRTEGAFRYVRSADLAEDALFMQGLNAGQPSGKQTPERALAEALERAVSRGTLLKASLKGVEGEETLYFLNSPKGRAAVDAIEEGRWRPEGMEPAPAFLDNQRPNIYRLYEENIGPLTPMIAEELREAETEYPDVWIEDAIRIAVESNKRSWRYVSAILRRWQEGGRDEQNRGDSEKDRRRYIEGEFADFIEH